MTRASEPGLDAFLCHRVEASAQQLATSVPAPEIVQSPRDAAAVVLIVRSPHGQVVTYAPIALSTEDGRLSRMEMLPEDPEDLQLLAIRQSEKLLGAGALFRARDGSTVLVSGLVQESVLAEDACVTSVTENYVRAMLDLPLGAPVMRGAAAALGFVRWAPDLHGALRHCMARDPLARIHLYGTEGVRGMTIGHVCVVADDRDDAARRARHAADYLTGTIEE